MKIEEIKRIIENGKRIDVDIISTKDGYHNNNGDYNYYSAYSYIDNTYKLVTWSSCDFIDDYEVSEELFTIDDIIDDIVYSKKLEDSSCILEVRVDGKLTSI